MSALAITLGMGREGSACVHSRVVARAVPPPLRAPDLGKRAAGRHHLVGGGGRRVLRNAQRSHLAHHLGQHTTLFASDVGSFSV